MQERVRRSCGVGTCGNIYEQKSVSRGRGQFAAGRPWVVLRTWCRLAPSNCCVTVSLMGLHCGVVNTRTQQ